MAVKSKSRQQPQAAACPFWKYWFTLNAGISQHDVGEFQGRQRCDLEYSNPTNGGPPLMRNLPGVLSPEEQTAWGHLVNASIVSGHDWVFINRDAVVDFDSSITLKVGQLNGVAVDGCFIAGRVRGRADLRACLDANGQPLATPGAPGEDFVKAWLAQSSGANLPLLLSVAFDVPVKGFNDDQNQVY